MLSKGLVYSWLMFLVPTWAHDMHTKHMAHMIVVLVFIIDAIFRVIRARHLIPGPDTFNSWLARILAACAYIFALVVIPTTAARRRTGSRIRVGAGSARDSNVGIGDVVVASEIVILFGVKPRHKAYSFNRCSALSAVRICCCFWYKGMLGREGFHVNRKD